MEIRDEVALGVDNDGRTERSFDTKTGAFVVCLRIRDEAFDIDIGYGRGADFDRAGRSGRLCHFQPAGARCDVCQPAG